MKRAGLILSAAALGLSAALAGLALAQEKPRPVPTHIYLKAEAVSGVPGKQTTMVSILWPPGSTTGRHYHDGDEYALVTEGEITLLVDGKAPRTIHAGEAYHNSAGLVHETKNAGSVPAYSIAVFVLDKGKPLQQPAR